MRVATIMAATLFATGCGNQRAILEDATATQQLPPAIELADAPFFPQADYQCGPAALATVLNYSGVATTPDELVDRVYIPARRGSLQIEILAATRHEGRLAYVIDPDTPALLAELADGRPVLILQNLGLSLAPVWHYAVVIGYDVAKAEFILRSGTNQRRVMSAARLFRTWEAADSWGMIALKPGELPGSPDAQKYLQAVTALERAGHEEAATRAYVTAVEAWPDSPSGYFGLGNAAYRSGDLARAELAFQAAVRLDPGNPAPLNNLAQVQMDRGRCSQAYDSLGLAEAAARSASQWQAFIARTRADIVKRCGPPESRAARSN